MKRACIVAGCLLAVGLLSAASVSAVDLSSDFVPRPGWVGLDVLVDGVPLRAIPYRGKTYLPVPRLGVEYQLRVRNHTPRRITALVAVDGLSVITGRPAAEDSPGYLGEPSGQVLSKGWRRDLDTVAAFQFVAREESYAARRGWPEGVGVISLLAFEEQTRRFPPPLLEGKRADSARGGARPSAAVGGTGTGYGRDVDSRVYYVPFVRSAIRHTVTLHYDTVKALRRAGVPVDWPPRPIPSPGPIEFAPPPPGR